MVLASIFAWLCMSAHADLSFDGQNRFVMKGKRLPITLVNEGKEPALAEISLDWGTDGKGQALPFAVSRPLLRLGAGQRAKVEVLYQGQGLPTDRETFLLLSVLDVPHAPSTPETLQIALRHRFKLFYRPALDTTVEQAIAGLTWTLGANGKPKARNPSPYHITFSQLEFLDTTERVCDQAIDHLMLAPFSDHEFDAIDCRPSKARYEIVSDAGNPRPYHSALKPGVETNATSYEVPAEP
ncbi:TPA: molecular chaperone [Pseudomonas aeruginosa]|nr:molecular chaperone [Pseudomonas aeruginosa]